MLTYKTVLNICFLIDFDKMAAVAEKKVMVVMGVFTSVTTLAHLAEEVVTRNMLGLDHYARWCFNIYLGEVTFVIVYIVNHIPFLLGKYFCTPEKCWRHWWTASHSHIIPHCFPSHLVGTQVCKRALYDKGVPEKCGWKLCKWLHKHVNDHIIGHHKCYHFVWEYARECKQ